VKADVKVQSALITISLVAFLNMKNWVIEVTKLSPPPPTQYSVFESVDSIHEKL